MRNRIGVVGVVLAVGMLVAACGSDPTASEAYVELESDHGQAVAERDQLATDLEAALAEVDASVAEAAVSEEEKATAVDDAAAVAEELRAIERSMAAVQEDLESAFDMTGVAATMWLSCGDPEAIADLPEEVAALRSDVAAAANWFESADDYDACSNRRAYNAADNAILRQDDPALTAAWDAWWDTEGGSEDEVLAYFEFELLRVLANLEAIDRSLDAVEAVVPLGLQNAEHA
ncbi:MAG: hypothetical protein ACR2N7_12845 [Acidimicrobiia bacterium]